MFPEITTDHFFILQMSKSPIPLEGFHVSFDPALSAAYLQKPEDFPDALLDQVRKLAFDGAPDAEEVLKNLLRTNPNFPFLRFLLAITFMKRADYAKAQEQVSELQASYPTFFWSIYAQAMLYRKDKDTDSLIQLLGEDMKISSILPEGTLLHLEEYMVWQALIGDIWIEQKAFDRAQEVVEEMSLVDPGHKQTKQLSEHLHRVQKSHELLAESQKLLDSMRYLDKDYKSPIKPVHREAPKIGRNDPCPCGSRKKYKKCCMN